MANRSEPRSSVTAETHSNTADPGDRPVVMVVDDEQQVLEIARRLIERLGYHALPESDPQTALTHYAHAYAQIDCVLLDLSMRPLDGLELFSAMHAINPEIRAILCSGYAEPDTITRQADLKFAGFLPKPYRIDELHQVLADVLANND